jgi:hypothetical protein
MELSSRDNKDENCIPFTSQFSAARVDPSYPRVLYPRVHPRKDQKCPEKVSLLSTHRIFLISTPYPIV